MSEIFHPGRALLRHMKVNGLISYGATIEKDVVHSLIGVVVPEVGTRADFESAQLAELNAVGYVRNLLIKQGMYLAQEGSRYRILLPHENKLQAESYLRSANKKMYKAQELMKHTPQKTEQIKERIEARILINQHSQDSRSRYGCIV